MPTLSKRRLHLRDLQLKKLRLTEIDTPRETDTSSESDVAESHHKEFEQLCDSELRFNVDDIADLFHLCLEKVDLRRLSVLMFVTLQYLNVTWRDSDNFLKDIEGLCYETTRKWARVFKIGDFEEFCVENRGGKRIVQFYDVFPDIELNAKAYAIIRSSKKTADFTVKDLAIYIDDQFHTINNIAKVNTDCLVRSVASCRLDLRAWGGRFEANTQRPYFEGHERPDVVNDRENFVKYFLERKKKYFTVSDDEQPAMGSSNCSFIMRFDM